MLIQQSGNLLKSSYRRLWVCAVEGTLEFLPFLPPKTCRSTGFYEWEDRRTIEAVYFEPFMRSSIVFNRGEGAILTVAMDEITCSQGIRRLTTESRLAICQPTEGLHSLLEEFSEGLPEMYEQCEALADAYEEPLWRIFTTALFSGFLANVKNVFPGRAIQAAGTKFGLHESVREAFYVTKDHE